MNFGRGFQSGFKRASTNSGAGFFKGQQGSFKNFARMQAHMNFSQINMLGSKMMMIQAQQNNLTAANMLMCNI